MSEISLALSILNLYPNLQPGTDFRCVCEEGIQSIAEWNNSNPQPTNDQLESSWFDVLKVEKKTILSQQCNVAIMSGFQSSSLGITHTYPSDIEAQLNFNSTMNRFLTDPNFTQINFKTLDAGYLTHNKDQFFKVFSDGHSYGDSQIAHLNDLKAQIDALTYPTNTEADLDAITW